MAEDRPTSRGVSTSVRVLLIPVSLIEKALFLPESTPRSLSWVGSLDPKKLALFRFWTKLAALLILTSLGRMDGVSTKLPVLEKNCLLSSGVKKSTFTSILSSCEQSHFFGALILQHLLLLPLRAAPRAEAGEVFPDTRPLSLLDVLDQTSRLLLPVSPHLLTVLFFLEGSRREPLEGSLRPWELFLREKKPMRPPY